MKSFFASSLKLTLLFVSLGAFVPSNAALTGVWTGLSGAGAGTATIAAGADAALTVTSNNAVNANGGTFTTTAGAKILGTAASYTSTEGNIVGEPALRYEHRWDANEFLQVGFKYEINFNLIGESSC